MRSDSTRDPDAKRGSNECKALRDLRAALENHVTMGPLRSAIVTGSVLEGYALADVLEQISVLAEEVLPVGDGNRFTFSGESEDFFESSNALFFAYFLALALIFLVLAAQCSRQGSR
jgi:multidrug efflux pump subunit AcrB